MTQIDLFSAPPDELDEAISVLTQTSLEWIIHRPLSLRAAEVLRQLKQKSDLSKKELKAFSKFGSYDNPLRELQTKYCVYYDSRKNPIRIGLRTDKIVELARLTTLRVHTWIVGEGIAA